ncbi:tautomerase family protein [Rathayibacter sp. VKM Ac-2927]|uniref:tautomerase family protein n=1 Tax=Rathayibacter sp. VKM Ac-2927 TaxID=2929478 RepID=UPI001FB375EC|nr:tautomerase family protein [Rathayibacter sp. VKM Ac-2927]MCJ1688351.1 tautomerase family protein [Rathayibacter sp. VKM Ac-2927]
MPHARIDLHSGYRDRLPELSAAILAGMVRGFDMPATDLFQTFRLHDPGELVFGRSHPEPPRDDIVFIEILAGVGYASSAGKHDGLVAIADELEAIGIPRHDLLLHVIEVPAGDWYSPGFAGIA